MCIRDRAQEERGRDQQHGQRQFLAEGRLVLDGGLQALQRVAQGVQDAAQAARDVYKRQEFVTPEAINFMVTHGRGLVCLTLTEERCRQLDLPLMAARNGTRYGTNFTQSIEAAEGVETGISAADRARTIQVAVARDAKPVSYTHLDVYKRQIPVYWIGVGESLEDLQPFVADEFAGALLAD